MKIKPQRNSSLPMIHEMHLDKEPFSMIRSGRKTVELRLNDDKRRKIKVADFIRFVLRGSEDIILAKVTALYASYSFAMLFEVGGMLDKCGLSDFTPKDAANRMTKYYSESDERANGALGIEFQIIISQPTETPMITL